MNPFRFHRVATAEAAMDAVTAARGAKFLGGGTNLIDLMKDDVMQPPVLIDINRVDLRSVDEQPEGGVMVGALVRNSDLASDATIVKNFPLLSQALLAGASPQLRNMATTGGNLMQRTRCYYFMDPAFPACNKRAPGTGCAAVNGFNRIHAILGQTDNGPASGETCIATNPSDMNVAMAALSATVHVASKRGKRTIPIAEFHRLPGTKPQQDTTLEADELITGVELPRNGMAANSWYLKIRDRNSYAFALVSVAAGLEMQGGTIRSAAFALGGVALKPWRSEEAERTMQGKPATPETFANAADICLRGAKGYADNQFKIEMAKRAVVRAFTLAARGTYAGLESAEPAGAQAGAAREQGGLA